MPLKKSKSKTLVVGLLLLTQTLFSGCVFSFRQTPLKKTSSEGTDTTPDTTAPSVNGGLSPSTVSATQITLSWGAATDSSTTNLKYKVVKAITALLMLALPTFLNAPVQRGHKRLT